MEKKVMKRLLKEAIFDVMDRMFFQPIQFVDANCGAAEWFPRGQKILGTTLQIDGEPKFFLYLFLSETMAQRLTADFLGLEGKPPAEEQTIDTAKEALNMIGGRMLSAMDEEGSWSIGLPSLVPQEALSGERLAAMKGGTVLIDTGCDRMAVLFRAE